MRTRLVDVVGWKGRNIPGNRVIPDHLKLAILARGRVEVPTGNVAWLVDAARIGGKGWPDRLQRDLPEIVPRVKVFVELFSNQRPAMTHPDITDVFHGYLALRIRRQLPHLILAFRWLPHDRHRELENRLDLDISLLLRKARIRVQPKRPDRYMLLAYACLPDVIARFVAPVTAQPPTPPAVPMPALEAITSPSTAKNIRDGPGDSSKILGTQVGAVIPVLVVDKRRIDGNLWFQIEVGSPLAILKDAMPATLPPGQYWIIGEEEKFSPTNYLLFSKGLSRVGGGLEWVAAPWDFFRFQLRAYEADNSRLSLNDRITKLRQMSHEKDMPFDRVIGSRQGTVYRDTRPFVADRWQLLKDYESVRTPDGRIIDLHHIMVGLDALQRPENLHADFLNVDIGSNWGAATWGGDLGGGATDMMMRAAKEWERRNASADFDTRAQYYFETRAGDRDLMADVDVWGIHALRSPERDSIDALMTAYYEHTLADGFRPVTSARRDALERYLAHYGFVYDISTDYQRYPFLIQQREARARVRSEIARFARIWSLRGNPAGRGVIDSTTVDAMKERFLYWLEYQTIENGASVEP